MTHNYSDTASVAQLGANMDAITTTLTVTGPSYTGFPGVPYWGMIARGTPSAEEVEVVAAAGTTLTVVRAQGGTAASSHSTGDTFEHNAPAVFFTNTETHADTPSGVHGVTGTVVGTTDAQTLSNKTYRGAHRAVFSDAQPAGVSASFLSEADDASARDGFVHKSTAGDVDRRALLTEQSGSPRVQVFNDGTVKLSPGASARPGLENDGTTQLDGATVLNAALTANGSVELNSTLQADGAAVFNSTAEFNGGVQLDGAVVANSTVTLNSPVEFNSTVQLDGTVAANAAVDVNSDLNVDGAFTPRTVTVQPVQGGDTTPRVLVRTNTTTDALRVESNAAVLQMAITGGGGINTIGNIFTLGTVTASGHMFSEGSSIPLIPVVTSLASVTSPVTNMLVFLTTDGLLYRRTATPAWVVHDRVIRRLTSRTADTAGVINAAVGATEVNIAKLSVEDLAVFNTRTYELLVDLSVTFSAAANSYMVRVRKDTALSGTVLAQWEWETVTSGFSDYKSFRKLWPCTADDSDFDCYVSIQRIAGAGTADVNGNGNSSFIINEDVITTGVHARVP